MSAPPATAVRDPGRGGETVVRLLVERGGRRTLRALDGRCPERTVDAGNETDIRCGPDFGLRQLGAWMAMTASAASANVGAGDRLPASRGISARLGDLPALEGYGPRLGKPHRRVVPDPVVGAPAADGEPLNPHLCAPRGDAQIEPVLVDEPRRPLGGLDLVTHGSKSRRDWSSCFTNRKACRGAGESGKRSPQVGLAQRNPT